VTVTDRITTYERDMLDDRTFDILNLTLALRDTWSRLSVDGFDEEIGWSQSYEISDIGIFTKTGLEAREAELLRGASNFVADTHTYSISDSAPAIASASSDVRNGAVNISATGNSTIAEAIAIAGASNSGTTTYNISDSAPAIASASSDVRNGAVNISATGNSTITEAIAIAGASNSGTTTYNIGDVAANLFEGSFPTRSLRANVGTVLDSATYVSISDFITLYEWDLLDDRRFEILNLTFALRDTWARISNEVNTDEIGWAQSYEISDIDTFTKSGLTSRQIEILRGAANFDADVHTYSSG